MSHHDVVIFRKRHHRKKKSRDWCNCDVPTCDGPGCCDLGLFSMLLTLGSVTAGVVRRPAVDRAGRAAILGYRRWLSHRWPATCRYTPTCSAYGLAAVERYGLAVGGRMAADRVRRCRPDVPHGTHDPLR
ncbi:membrane protein insertion efficiency factor YidD [Micromonospora aurantiaca]|uniref:membrane protein insertion efficiency factor YidD n=1 Tax=Micromonospora aurantiaca (nom. illeg.) TaxID=47850 RepID=UPI003456335F